MSGTDPDALRESLSRLSGEQIRSAIRRNVNFTFRVSPLDRETMDRAAKALTISTGEYLIRLHNIAYDILRRDMPGLFASAREAARLDKRCGMKAKATALTKPRKKTRA